MVCDGQGRALDANKNLYSSRFAGNWLAVDETSCFVSEDETDEQSHGSEWTRKFSQVLLAISPSVFLSSYSSSPFSHLDMSAPQMKWKQNASFIEKYNE